MSEAGWNDAIAINLTGSFLGAKHQIAEMLKHGGGSVIFTSTFVGYSFAFPGVAAYAARKSGLIGLTQALAAEFGPLGVRVNAILPGAVETGMYPMGGVQGPATDIDIEAREIIKMRERLSQIIATETGQSIERVRKDTDRNYWMSASEAIDYGLASKIVHSIEDLK